MSLPLQNLSNAKHNSLQQVKVQKLYMQYKEATSALENATLLYKQSELNTRICDIAKQIKQETSGIIPVFLTVMNGGMFFATNLLQQLDTPFHCEYIHISRYGDNMKGSSVFTWHRAPKAEVVANRDVYLIDDILDEGYTLMEIKKFVLNAKAKSCKIVALVDKDLGRPKPITADYVGVVSPNKFLFGYGMDLFGLYRQLPNIYAYNITK